MIIRIVKLTFEESFVPDFIETFKLQQEHIAGFEGCTRLELLRDERNPNIFFTYSHWEDVSYLETYRDSPFFTKIWAKVKPHFTDKPLAWSTKKMEV